MKTLIINFLLTLSSVGICLFLFIHDRHNQLDSLDRLDAIERKLMMMIDSIQKTNQYWFVESSKYVWQDWMLD